MVSSIDSFGPPMPSDPSERSAAEVVQKLRAALRHSNAEEAQTMRWLAPRPAGERDLLSDLAAAEGLEPAVKRLSRFWRKAEVRLERVRAIGPLEAEVYERLTLPAGESLPIVTLVRRPAVDASWRVVCMNEAHDERFVIWLTSVRDDIDDVTWSREFYERFGKAGELIMDGEGGVLGDPEQGWLAQVRGPFWPLEWPDQLPGEGGPLVELAAVLTSDWDARRAQLTWLLETSAVFLSHLGGPAAYLALHDKLVLPQALDAAVASMLRPEQALRFWARLEEADGHYVTSGLRQLALPEVEAAVKLHDDPSAAARLVRWLGARLVEGGAVPPLGTEVVFNGRTLMIVHGRRGPRRGKSYGRWGAVRIAEADARYAARGSRTRLRVPDNQR
jgi:hypothetical protein